MQQKTRESFHLILSLQTYILSSYHFSLITYELQDGKIVDEFVLKNTVSLFSLLLMQTNAYVRSIVLLALQILVDFGRYE